MWGSGGVGETTEGCELNLLKNLFSSSALSRLPDDSLPLTLRQEHTSPTAGRLKHLERLGRGRDQICLVCSALSEAFGASWMLSAPIEHAKSEEVGRRTSEPLDSLIGCVPAEWPLGGVEYCVRFVFLCTSSHHSRFHVLQYWHQTSSLVMPRCMFSMQLFLYGIIKFRK